jgi:hypothetical protein
MKCMPSVFICKYIRHFGYNHSATQHTRALVKHQFLKGYQVLRTGSVNTVGILSSLLLAILCTRLLAVVQCNIRFLFEGTLTLIHIFASTEIS